MNGVASNPHEFTSGRSLPRNFSGRTALHGHQICRSAFPPSPRQRSARPEPVAVRTPTGQSVSEASAVKVILLGERPRQSSPGRLFAVVASTEDVRRDLERLLDEPVRFAVPATERDPTVRFWRFTAVVVVVQVSFRILAAWLGTVAGIAAGLAVLALATALLRRSRAMAPLLPRNVIFGLVGNEVVVASAGTLRMSRPRNVSRRFACRDLRFLPSSLLAWDRLEVDGFTWFTNPWYRRELVRLVSSAEGTA